MCGRITRHRVRRSGRAMPWPALLAAVLAAWPVLLASGCGGHPQLAPQNRRLVESLRTAVSARRADWLELNAKLIESRHNAGSLSADEYRALRRIVELAQRGKWEQADDLALALHKAQRLTEADRQRLRQRAGHGD